MSTDHDDGGTRAPNTSATSTTSTDLPTLVQAPPMLTKIFPTWEDFSVYFDEYQRQTFQVYVIKSSTSVTTRNLKITQVHDKNTGTNSQKMPFELKFYSKMLICTHGGKPRSRSQGLRPHQTCRPMECPARMNVVAKRKPGNSDTLKASGWRIVVTQHRAIHNHPLTAETFMGHPRNRKLEDPMVLEAVNALRKAGVKRSAIRKYITEKEPSKYVTRSDVNNLLAKMKNDNFATTQPLIESSPVTQRIASVEVSDRSERSHKRVSSAELSDRPHIERTHENSAPGLSYSSSGGSPETQQNDVVMLKVTHPHEGRHEYTEVSNGSFRLRTRRDSRDPDNASTTTGTPSPQCWRVTSEMASGSFRLRTSRLEEQNAALYAQNTVLMEQNRMYVSQLDEAHKRAARQEAVLVDLQRSISSLTRMVREQSQEIAHLKSGEREIGDAD